MELRVSGKGQKDLTGVFFPAQILRLPRKMTRIIDPRDI